MKKMGAALRQRFSPRNVVLLAGQGMMSERLVNLPADEAALAFKSLWRVERTFREEKSTLEMGPIYHQRDAQCIGHIVARFLALCLEVDPQQLLGALEVEAPGRKS